MSFFFIDIKEMQEQADEMLLLNSHHNVDDILDEQLRLLESAASIFALDAMKDSKARAHYQKNIKRFSDLIKEEVKTKKITVKNAAILAHKIRGVIMEETRLISSATAKAYAKSKKSGNPSIDVFEEKYSQKNFNKKFSSLSASEKEAVYRQIINSAGRDNPKVTQMSKRLKIASRVAVVVTAYISVTAIADAENKPKELIRQGVILGSSAAGGRLAGRAAAARCGPNWICVGFSVLVGGMFGGTVANETIEYLDDEIEEFSKWAF